MKKLIFTCKTITPLVMNGPYGNVPELRPPGIKASLRFWWRALHGHLTLKELAEKESEIFGSNQGRSKLLIRIEQGIDESQKTKESLLPHKGGSVADAYRTGLEFKIKVSLNIQDTDFDFNMEQLKGLFVIACTLGGWGKRSRRGFGSISVIEIDGVSYSSPTSLVEIMNLLNVIVLNKYKISGTQIESNSVTEKTFDEYPKLWKIEIGKKKKSLEEIGNATHLTMKYDDKSNNKDDYSKSIGSGRPRFASPIYISLLENGLPIISTLKKNDKVNFTLQNALKSKILT